MLCKFLFRVCSYVVNPCPLCELVFSWTTLSCFVINLNINCWYYLYLAELLLSMCYLYSIYRSYVYNNNCNELSIRNVTLLGDRLWLKQMLVNPCQEIIVFLEHNTIFIFDWYRIWLCKKKKFSDMLSWPHLLFMVHVLFLLNTVIHVLCASRPVHFLFNCLLSSTSSCGFLCPYLPLFRLVSPCELVLSRLVTL